MVERAINENNISLSLHKTSYISTKLLKWDLAGFVIDLYDCPFYIN